MSIQSDNEENELIEENNNQENLKDTENMSEPNNNSDLTEKLEKEKDRYIRLFAEFDNYKKRVIKERQDLLKYSDKDILESLLPVLDDFDRAITELEKKEDDLSVLEGVKLIYNKLFNTLKDRGLTVIDVKAGDDFNIDYHEAITQVPSPDESLKGKIIDVVQKGYLLHEKVIRYAKVVIGN
ncbi:nucleotide exchange factor GrpE [Apibacter sp. B3706]|uniref:nucleotide exchange factor GrpE n=1 Tax=Apibacter TaxID=1778601 RepID=UPI001329850F|nr:MULTISPECIES: nucleotide exchange factor GrpE [Apibacter]MCX8676355.1 nucleotide exchange factor GrpE [Apibacter sp. B3919]MXO23819.1 nucleotide exchange factor GrpE [Apibacter sp. B3924]MXO26503.1 nucleotide exchange factor GrpE [Apibacter sp. B3813]MXO28455.1 nucleotide exchange factor GrpE [Apibacter sp. B3913]MXO30409.1 nucleotide exchange factor GrpE [Apibacter sp. B3912]